MNENEKDSCGTYPGTVAAGMILSTLLVYLQAEGRDVLYESQRTINLVMASVSDYRLLNRIFMSLQ